MVKNLLIAMKFVKKQIVLNLIIVMEVLLSIVMLSELYVYVSDRIDNQRAAYELLNSKLFVVEAFEYEHSRENELMEKLIEEPNISKVGKADVLSCAIGEQEFYLGIYNEDLIDMYGPLMSEGSWFSRDMDTLQGVPGVVSADTGLSTGDRVEVFVEPNAVIDMQVIGVLATPTQYLLPTGMSDSIDALISQQPVVLLNGATVPCLAQGAANNSFGTNALFVLTDLSKEQLIEKYNQYGYIQSINQMVERFVADSNELMICESFLLALFCVLAAIVILATEVMHYMSCRKKYTIYYLLGMQWKECVKIELIRHVLLIAIILILSILLDSYGLLQTAWLSDYRRVLFYAVVIVYLVLMFFGISAAFVYHLLHHDISVSLKNLHGGE